jgi:guanine deaminase
MNAFMQVAYDEALAGMLANAGGPFGAVITKNHKIVASGHNTVFEDTDPTAHAEINVIRQACRELASYNLSECQLYTSSMPCPMCLGAILWARIPIVYYGAAAQDAARGGFDDQRFYEMIRSQKLDLVIKRIDSEGGAALFDLWLAKEDRQHY